MATFKRDTFVYGLAVAADRLIGFILLPLLTSGLSKQDFGAWSQISVAYGLFSTALLLGFFHTISGLAARRPAKDSARVYAGVLGLVCVSSALFVGACAVWPRAVSHVLFADAAYSYVIPAMAWFTVTECFYELVVLAVLRSQGRIIRCSIYHGAKNVLRLVAVCIGLFTPDPLISILGLLGMVNAIMVIYVLRRFAFPSGISSPVALGWPFWRAAVTGAGATAGAVLLAWGNISLNRFLIVQLEGLHELAVYSANYSILSIVTLLPMIINFTLLHHLSVKMAADAVQEARSIISRSLTYYLYATLPLLMLVLLFYDGLLALLTPGEYEGGMMLAATLGAYFFIFGIEQILVFATFPNSGVKALGARLLALGVNVGACAALIPAFGIAYAAVPLLAASLVVVFICSFVLREQLGHRFPWQASVSIVGAGLLTLGAGLMLEAQWKAYGAWMIGYQSLALTVVYLVAESLMPASITRALLGLPPMKSALQTYYRKLVRR
ncbi:MAG TPA: oligosaccharide flippase family protein [Burkholderiales bacterium]|nr:oligosaccharide flippase family protein [Burkholderiales bacterium]